MMNPLKPMQNYKNHTKTANIFHYILENAQLWLRRNYSRSEKLK